MLTIPIQQGRGITITDIELKKRWLEDYRFTKMQYRDYINELEVIQARKVSMVKILTGMPSGNVPKRMDDTWVELMNYTDEVIEYLKGVIQDLKQDLTDVENAIKKLPKREQALIVARYIRNVSYREIQKELMCSERTMYLIHESALEHLQLPEHYPI